MRLVKALLAVAGLAAIVVPSAAAIRFSDASLLPPRAIAGAPYFHKLDGAAGCNEHDYEFRVTGGSSLPPGLRLAGSTEDWRIEGVPTKLGSWPVWLELGSDCEPQAERRSQRQITIVVSPPLAVVETSLRPGVVGAAYRARLTATWAAPLDWSLVTGALPPGLVLADDGTIAGTPRAPGVYGFTVEADPDPGQAVTRTFRLTIARPLALGAARLAPARVGRRYAAALPAEGGAAPFRWRLVAGRLPAGVRLDPRTGRLSGRPRAAGRYRLVVGVSDAAGRGASRTYVLSVRR